MPILDALNSYGELWRRTLSRSAIQVARTAMNFVLPAGCACCAREIESESFFAADFCTPCRQALVAEPGPECRRCAAPVAQYQDTSQGCYHCRDDRFHFDGVIRLGVYGDALRQAILQGKSPGGEAVCRALTDLLYHSRAADWSQTAWDVVVPVPAHWTRRLTPHSVASEAIAGRLAELLKIPCERGLLRKIRRTPRQVGTASMKRRKQQRGAFRGRADLSGAKILLVDDVLTTGATANEAAQALKARGATQVTVAVIARAVGEHA